MRYWKNNKGSSLVEVMAAGVVLTVMAIMTTQILSMSANLMERGRALKKLTDRSVLAAECGELPEETEHAELILDVPGGRESGISVTINRYGNIFLLTGREGQTESSETETGESDELQKDR